MKKVMVSSMLSLVLGVAGVGVASAQSCNSTPDAAGSANLSAGTAVTANTCSSDDSIALYCSGYNSGVGEPDYVFKVHLAAPGSPQRTATALHVVGSGGFTPAVFVFSASGPCGQGGLSCPVSASNGFDGDITGLAAGDYYIGVTGPNNGGAAGCGGFTLSAITATGTPGTLPVKLTSFNVN